jgi:hypothetical protein
MPLVFGVVIGALLLARVIEAVRPRPRRVVPMAANAPTAS